MPFDLSPGLFFVALAFIVIFALMVIHRIYLKLYPRIKVQKVTRYNAMNDWDINSPIVETIVPPAPEPPSAKWLLYLAGLACFVVPLVFLAQAPYMLNIVSAGVYVVFIIIGIKAFKLGQDADQKHAQNMEARASAQRSHAAYERARIETANAKHEAQRRAHIQFYEDNAKLEAIEVQRRLAIQQQRNINHLEHFRQDAFNAGVDLKSVVEVNKQGLLNQKDIEKKRELDKLDTQKYQEEVKVNLDAGNRLELADADKVEQLRDKLERVIDKRYEVAADTTKSEEHKRKLLARYDKDIQYLEDQIDAIQTRLLPTQNRQAAGRIEERSSNGRSNYPPPSGDDEE